MLWGHKLKLNKLLSVLAILLILPFYQNCTDSFKKKSSSNTKILSSGNGDSYEGKFVAIDDASKNIEYFSNEITAKHEEGDLPLSVSGEGSPTLYINEVDIGTSGRWLSDRR